MMIYFTVNKIEKNHKNMIFKYEDHNIDYTASNKFI